MDLNVHRSPRRGHEECGWKPGGWDEKAGVATATKEERNERRDLTGLAFSWKPLQLAPDSAVHSIRGSILAAGVPALALTVSAVWRS